MPDKSHARYLYFGDVDVYYVSNLNLEAVCGMVWLRKGTSYKLVAPVSDNDPPFVLFLFVSVSSSLPGTSRHLHVA
jgi:hypothetical protein